MTLALRRMWGGVGRSPLTDCDDRREGKRREGPSGGGARSTKDKDEEETFNTFTTEDDWIIKKFLTTYISRNTEVL